MTDIEIANQNKILEITEVAKKLKLNLNDLEYYGKYKAKINYTNYSKNENSKLILVTSIHPTPYGEGKTTVSIGINDALQKLNYNSIAVLREPSLGPVFGIKGGATGGGYAQMIPMEDINLHFNGDMHAVTSCNNLLCALIDNHIFQGNELNIDPETICFHRTIDMNDRALRKINLSNREEHFSITAASEIMAILCLSQNLSDLKDHLNNIFIGYSFDKKPIFVRDLKCEGSLAILLKEALKPNLVQSLEHNPILVHGGPFANIAHGCSSLISLNLGLSLADYVITEAGFGSDLGAEKFFDIVCRHDLKPDLVILNATIRSLKYNGGCPKEDINTSSISYLKNGICNLEAHINNLKKFNTKILVVLNRFHSDSLEEINFVKEFVQKLDCPFEICEAYTKGSKGTLDVAKKIVEMTKTPNNFKALYSLNDSIENKIETICTKIYHANKVIYSPLAKQKITELNSLGFKTLPICIAKTQYSFSDDSKKLGNPVNYSIHIEDISLKSGAGFIVVFLGKIIDMPSLPRTPNALNMKIDDLGNMNGLF